MCHTRRSRLGRPENRLRSLCPLFQHLPAIRSQAIAIRSWERLQAVSIFSSPPLAKLRYTPICVIPHRHCIRHASPHSIVGSVSVHGAAGSCKQYRSPTPLPCIAALPAALLSPAFPTSHPSNSSTTTANRHGNRHDDTDSTAGGRDSPSRQSSTRLCCARLLCRHPSLLGSDSRGEEAIHEDRHPSWPLLE